MSAVVNGIGSAVSSIANGIATAVKAPFEFVGDVVSGRNVFDAAGAAVGKVASGLVASSPTGAVLSGVGGAVGESGKETLGKITFGISDLAYNVVDTANDISNNQGILEFGKNELGATERDKILDATKDAAALGGVALATAATLGAATPLAGAAGAAGAKLAQGGSLGIDDALKLGSAATGGTSPAIDVSPVKEAFDTIRDVSNAVQGAASGIPVNTQPGMTPSSPTPAQVEYRENTRDVYHDKAKPPADDLNLLPAAALAAAIYIGSGGKVSL